MTFSFKTTTNSLIKCMLVSFLFLPSVHAGQHSTMLRRICLLGAAGYIFDAPEHIKYSLLRVGLSFDSAIDKIKEDPILAQKIGQSLSYSSFSSYLTELPTLTRLRRACAHKLEQNNIPLNLTPTEGLLLACSRKTICQWFNHTFFLRHGRPNAPDDIKMRDDCLSTMQLIKGWCRLIPALNCMLAIEKKHWHGDQRYYPLYTGMSASTYILSYMTTLDAQLDPEKILLLRPQIAPETKDFLYSEYIKNRNKNLFSAKFGRYMDELKSASENDFEMHVLVYNHIEMLQKLEHLSYRVDGYDQSLIRAYLLSNAEIHWSEESKVRLFTVSTNISPIANLQTHGETSLRPFLENQGLTHGTNLSPLMCSYVLSGRFSPDKIKGIIKACSDVDGGIMLQLLVSKELLEKVSYCSNGYGLRSEKKLISIYDNLANFPLSSYEEMLENDVFPIAELIVTDDLLADPKNDIAQADLKIVTHPLYHDQIRTLEDTAKRMLT